MAKSIPSRSSQTKKSAARGTTKATAPKGAAASKVVTVDRRGRADKAEQVEKGGDRRGVERRTKGEPVVVERRQLERREKVNRRRQIDPTTCEREYSDLEVEFMNALELYKRKNGRMFPTCSEILEVIISLGYRKASEIEAMPMEAAVMSAEPVATSEVAPEQN